MSWVTYTEVKTLLGYPSTGAPVSDADITSFITYAQNEVENIYHTKFGNIETSGTANSGTGNSLTKTSAGWTVNGFADMVVWIDGGTGVGQYRKISSNTADTLTVSDNWDTNPDNTSTYKVLTLGYINETVDGSGTPQQFFNYFPITSINSLIINNVTVTPSKTYIYPASGKVILKNDAESRLFMDAYPQQVSMKYTYGVYPIPTIIKRLTMILAGLRTLSAQLGAGYSDYYSINLPGITASSVQVYQIVPTTIKQFQDEARHIVEETYRPFTLFG
jgi:hypothetical protein